MKKKRMARSKAETIVREAREAFFEPLNKLGLLEVGTTNLDGELITEERVAKIRQIIDGAGWAILRDSFDIVEG